MTRFFSILILILAAGILCIDRARAAFGPVLLVDCGASEQDTGTYVTAGTYCTSNQNGCNQTNRDHARADANRDFDASITSSHECKTCIMGEPPSSYICDPTFTKSPSTGYADGDCICGTTPMCQGNPLKTLITMTCTASISWEYECSNPCL
jgi:hypothetical protein